VSAAASPVPRLSQIEAWDTSHLHQAATFWTNTATAWEDAFNTVYHEMQRPGGTSGKAPPTTLPSPARRAI
jgi:hypothetical protein